MALIPIIGGIAKGLAKAGVIRGTAGRLLGGGAKKALPAISGQVGPLMTGGGMAAAPSAIGKTLRAVGGVAASGAAFEVGSGIVRRIRKDGKPYKRRRMNPANPRALTRALRRAEAFQKLVKRSFIVSDIKPRKRSCR